MATDILVQEQTEDNQGYAGDDAEAERSLAHPGCGVRLRLKRSISDGIEDRNGKGREGGSHSQKIKHGCRHDRVE